MPGLRLLAVALSALLALAGLLVGPAPAQAGPDRPESEYCEPRWFYVPVTNRGQAHQGVGVVQSNSNNTSREATSTFTSSASGTVSFGADQELQGGASIAIASVSSKIGMRLSYSIQVQAGVSISVPTPSRMTTHGSYGVYRQVYNGRNGYLYSNCHEGQVRNVTTYSPVRTGWRIWETRN